MARERKFCRMSTIYNGVWKKSGCDLLHAHASFPNGGHGRSANPSWLLIRILHGWACWFPLGWTSFYELLSYGSPTISAPSCPVWYYDKWTVHCHDLIENVDNFMFHLHRYHTIKTKSDEQKQKVQILSFPTNKKTSKSVYGRARTSGIKIEKKTCLGM